MRYSFTKVLIGLATAVALIFGSIGAADASSSKAGTVYFASGSSVLSKDAKKKLNALVTDLNAGSSVTVNGYVQKAGTNSNNKSLSKARAKAVAKYLKSKGVTVTIEYSGKSLPASKVTSSKARRASIYLTPATASAPLPTYSVTGSLKIYTEVTDCNEHFVDSVSLIASDGSTVKAVSDLKVSDSLLDTTTFPYTCTYNWTLTEVPAGNYSVKYSITCAAYLNGCNSNANGLQAGAYWWSEKLAFCGVTDPVGAAGGIYAAVPNPDDPTHFKFVVKSAVSVTGDLSRTQDIIQDYYSPPPTFLPTFVELPGGVRGPVRGC